MTPVRLLALVASSLSPDPAALRASLVRAAAPVASMEACAGLQPRYEKRYQSAYAAHAELTAAADSLFGRSPSLEAAEAPVAPSGCGQRAFDGYETEARAEAAQARAALTAVTTRMPGLWFGTMRICRADVAVARVEPYLGDSMWMLTVELVPALRQRLLSETERRIGEPMSLRIDGRAAMQPVVNEPLTGGAMTLTGPDRREVEEVRAAALRDC